MQKQKSIKINFVMNAILTMSSFIFPLITFPYASRVLLPTGLGKVAFATSIISYFRMIARLGIPTYGIRACAKVRDDKIKLTRTVHELVVINLVMTLVSYVLLALCILFVPRLQDEKALYLVIASSMLFDTIGMEWLYKALEQYAYITIRSIIFKFIALVSMFLLVQSEGDYIIYGGITIIASSASNIYNFINVRKYISFKPLGKYQFAQHINATLVFFAMTCSTVIYTNMDTVMLGFMTNDADVGYYNAAVKIKSVLVSVVTSLGAVLLPRASYYIEHNMQESFLKISKKALNFVFVLAVPLAVFFTIFAEEGMVFLSGEEYSQSVLPMQIIMPTLLVIGLTNLMGIQMLVPMGREKSVLYSEVIGACVNIVLNLILIPRYTVAGAAIGTLFAEIAVFCYQFAALKGVVMQAFRRVRYGTIVIASLIAALLSTIVVLLELGVALTLFSAAFVFFSVYGMLLLLLKEPLTLDIVSHIWKKLYRERRK